MKITYEPRPRQIITRLIRQSPRYVRLASLLLRDGRLSPWHKAPLAGAIGYGLSPVDLVPGIVPLLGQLDDLIVLLGALKLTIDRIPAGIANEHLLAVGLLKSDLDADFDNTVRLARGLVVGGARGAARMVRSGTRFSFRLASAGVRSFRPR